MDITILLFSVPAVTVRTTRKCLHLAQCTRARALVNCLAFSLLEDNMWDYINGAESENNRCDGTAHNSLTPDWPRLRYHGNEIDCNSREIDISRLGFKRTYSYCYFLQYISHVVLFTGDGIDNLLKCHKNRYSHFEKIVIWFLEVHMKRPYLSYNVQVHRAPTACDGTTFEHGIWVKSVQTFKEHIHTYRRMEYQKALFSLYSGGLKTIRQKFEIDFFIITILSHTQCVPRGKVNILGGHSIDHSKQKVYVYMCPIPNGFRDRAISLYSSLYTAQTSNTPCPHTSCKVHWCWRWNFRKCITLGKLYQLCHLNNKYQY
jgi:hypothetical protein